MPRVVYEALQEPDVFATFIVAVVVLGLVAWRLAPRLRRPRWLLALALWSLAAILAATVVPRGGWDTLGRYPGGLDAVLACFDAGEWMRPEFSAPDLLLNVILYLPAALLWTAVSASPLRTVVALGALSFVTEAVQALTGDRSCTATDVLANSAGALLGASAGAVLGIGWHRAGGHV